MNKPYQNLKVLVVENNVLILQVLEELITQLDLNKTIFIKSAEQASAIHKENEDLHVTFIEHDLPNNQCEKLLAELKESDPKKYVIVISNETRAEEVEKILDQGADGYLAMPYTQNKLMNALIAYFDRH